MSSESSYAAQFSSYKSGLCRSIQPPHSLKGIRDEVLQTDQLRLPPQKKNFGATRIINSLSQYGLLKILNGSTEATELAKTKQQCLLVTLL